MEGYINLAPGRSSIVHDDGTIHIGTSGWHYDHWKGPFYPEDLPTNEFLPYFAGHLHTVEINNSFYRLPEASTFRAWREAVSDDFIFAVKASRFITHMKKLKDPEEPLRRLYDRAEVLGSKLGPILFQLPPNWHVNVERLRAFLDALSDEHWHVFEFRHPSWYGEQTFNMLADNGTAFCIYELAGHTSPRAVTAGFAYVRLHGPGAAYQGRYDEQVLADWMQTFASWRREGRDVYCYFDNDDAGHAVHNAMQLGAMVTST